MTCKLCNDTFYSHKEKHVKQITLPKLNFYLKPGKHPFRVFNATSPTQFCSNHCIVRNWGHLFWIFTGLHSAFFWRPVLLTVIIIIIIIMKLAITIKVTINYIELLKQVKKWKKRMHSNAMLSSCFMCCFTWYLDWGNKLICFFLTNCIYREERIWMFKIGFHLRESCAFSYYFWLFYIQNCIL